MQSAWSAIQHDRSLDGFTLDPEVHLKYTWVQVYLKNTWSALSFLPRNGVHTKVKMSSFVPVLELIFLSEINYTGKRCRTCFQLKRLRRQEP